MINLEKKKTINLTKSAPSLNQVRVGLSWDDVQINGQSPDCDAAAFMLGENGKLPNESSFVFYNNLVSGDGAVRYGGDNKTGAGDGDDETIDITLSQVSPSINQIILTITINNTDAGFNFGTVKNARVKIYNSANNSIICDYKMTESCPDCDGIYMGAFYRNGADWEFQAMGDTASGGLGAIVELYS